MARNRSADILELPRGDSAGVAGSEWPAHKRDLVILEALADKDHCKSNIADEWSWMKSRNPEFRQKSELKYAELLFELVAAP